MAITINSAATSHRDWRTQFRFTDPADVSTEVPDAVARRKQNREWSEIAEAIDDVLVLVDPPLALSLDLHFAARALAQTHGLSFDDAMIVATAIAADCETLYSEGMQHGRAIGNITIHKPSILTQQDVKAASSAGDVERQGVHDDYNFPFALLGSLTIALNRVGSWLLSPLGRVQRALP